MKWWERLNQAAKDEGWGIKEVAEKSGVPYDSVNKYMRGDVDNPRGAVLDQLAAAFGKTRIWLLTGLDPVELSGGLVHRSLLRTPIRGEVAAGVWLDISEPLQDPPRGWLPFGFQFQTYIENNPIYALTVRGNSVDKIAPEGSHVVCWTFGASEAGSGELVVIERLRHQEGLREITVKRIWRRADQILLVPESTDERWKPLVFKGSGDGEDTTLQVLARVMYVVSEPAPADPILHPFAERRADPG